MIFVLALISLSGCGHFSNSTPLPPPPASLIICAAEVAIDMPPGPWSRAQTAEIMAKLRQSELAGHRCAGDFAAWYKTLHG